MKKPRADVYRKVRFRELAREIVGKDRHDRRAGYAVDTAGSIARALERAYRDGSPLKAGLPARWRSLASFRSGEGAASSCFVLFRTSRRP
jgi:hypothetical protein